MLDQPCPMVDHGTGWYLMYEGIPWSRIPKYPARELVSELHKIEK